MLRGIEKLLPKKGEQVISIQQNASNGGSMVMRGQFALDDGDFQKAAEYFERALDRNPQDGAAYLGKVLAALHLSNANQIDDILMIQDNKDFDKAIRFSDSATAQMLTGIRDKAYQNKFEQAEERMQSAQTANDYRIAAELFEKLGDYSGAQEKYRLCLENAVQWTRQKTIELSGKRKRSEKTSSLIAVGAWHTVGLKSDGTVVAMGDNRSGQCNVSDWKDIVAVSAGWSHTVSLKSDGTVVAVGWNKNGQCNVFNWKDVVAVSAGAWHTMGLKSDGMVVVVGSNEYGQCNVSDWKDIVAVSAGYQHMVGLKSDGMVVAVGSNERGQCNVSNWKDIVAVSAGENHTVGLKSDGTVVAVGSNEYGQCNVSDWKDIVAVSVGIGYLTSHTVGLKSNGTVVAVGDSKYGQCNVSAWMNIVAVSAGGGHTVGLKPDGTVVAVGYNKDSQCNVSDWKLFTSIDTLEEERNQEQERLVKQREENKDKLDSLSKKQSVLKDELANLKGLFTGKRRREITDQLQSIEFQITRLQNELR